MNKYLKRGLITAACFLLAFFIAGAVAGNFFYELALNPHSDKSSVTSSEQNEIVLDTTLINAGREWFFENAYEEAYIQSYDGLALHSYRLENPLSSNWVILCHGYLGNAAQMSYYAMEFYSAGYSVLMPNARGHGQSEGDYIGMGWHDRLDVTDWIHWLNESYADTQIVLFGVSMGGATVMMASGEDLPQNVVAVVEDCGYSSVFDEFAYQLKGVFGLPSFPIMNFASAVAKIRAGYTMEEADALGQVAKSRLPTLFIHGSEDTFVPTSMVYDAYEACPNEKELLIIEGAGHGAAGTHDPALYWATIHAFLASYI